MNAHTRTAKKAPVTGLTQKLDAIFFEWQRTGIEPPVLGALSSGEQKALLIAARQEKQLDSPLRAFLRLEGPLQAWILERREMQVYIDTKIGGRDAFCIE